MSQAYQACPKLQLEPLGIQNKPVLLNHCFLAYSGIFPERPPQMAADFGQHNPGMKRLGDIIIRPVLQRHNLVHLTLTG
ncbi:hypothetical protein D3C80_2088290 [compost metagenome]